MLDFKVEIQTDICARPIFARLRKKSNLENGNISSDHDTKKNEKLAADGQKQNSKTLKNPISVN